MKGIPQSPVTVWFRWLMAYIFPILRPECPRCYARMKPCRGPISGDLAYECDVHSVLKWYPCDESLKEWGERYGR